MSTLLPRSIPAAMLTGTGINRITTVTWISDADERSACHLSVASTRGTDASCGAKIDHARADQVLLDGCANTSVHLMPAWLTS